MKRRKLKPGTPVVLTHPLRIGESGVVVDDIGVSVGVQLDGRTLPCRGGCGCEVPMVSYISDRWVEPAQARLA